MQGFTYYAPTEVVFGKETEEQTGRLIKKYGGLFFINNALEDFAP